MSDREFARAVRAESVKLHTLWPWWVAAAGTVAVVVVCAVAFASAWREGGVRASTITEIGLRALPYAHPGFVLLGALAAASEYHDGQAAATFAAMPRRGRVVVAKACAVIVYVLPLGALAAGLALGTTAVIVAPDGVAFGSIATAAAAVVVATAAAVIGVGLGLLARSVLWSVAPATFVIAVIGPLLREGLPSTLWMPDTPGYRLAHPELFAAQGPLWAAWLSGAGWTGLAIAAAIVVVRRRDA